MVPESAGILIPSETTLLSAGVAAHDGLTTVQAAVIAAAIGNLLGAGIAYWAGRAGVMRAGRLRSVGVLTRCRALVERRGNLAVFWGRLLPLARTFISFPAGDARLPLLPFAGLTLLGSLIWAVPFVVAGDVAGATAQRIGGVLGWALLVVGILAVMLALRPKSD